MFKLPSPLQQLDISHLNTPGLQVWIKRDDLIHPQVSGNKWRKLKHYFSQPNHAPIVSFGGAYSNHLHALAYAAHYFKREVHAIVRADFIDPDNQTLHDCLAQGMTVECVDRQTYRQKNQTDYLNRLKVRFPDAQIIAEGGFGEKGMQGVADIVDELEIDFTHIVCPVGSATTLAGLTSRLQAGQTAIGVGALKQAEYLKIEVGNALKLLGAAQLQANYQLWTDWHFGGFGKLKPELLDFIADFYQRYQILLDPVYTGKMMFALFNAIEAGFFAESSCIIALHTGGLQGWRGFAQRGLLPDDFLPGLSLGK